MTIQKLQDDLNTSLKAHDKNRVDTLRLMISEVRNAAIEKRSDLTEEELTAVLRKMVKKLKEAMEMFETGGRADLVEEHRIQIAVISEYLPADMTDDELEAAVDALIAEHGASKAIIGIAMKSLSSRAEPGRIMSVIQKKL